MKIIEFVKSKVSIIIISVCLFMAGLFIIGKIVSIGKVDVIEQHDDHIVDLANSVDHNVDLTLKEIYQVLDSINTDPEIADCERYYLETGDYSGLLSAFDVYRKLSPNYMNDIVFFRNEYDVISVEGNYYNIFDIDMSKNICFLKDDNGDYNNILRYQKSSNSDIYYGLVMDFVSLYNYIVTETVYSNYWIVLYDSSRDLALQNDLTQSIYTIIAKDEIADRNDGFTEILKCEEENKRKTIDYSYQKDGKQTDSRMYIIPKSLTTNGYFSVSVAIYESQITSNINKWSVAIIISSLLLTLAVFLILVYLFQTNNRERNLDKEISELKSENKQIAEKNKKREELEHQQKLETIGTLTTGIAHEFNNLLAPIMANSLLAIEKTPEDNTELYDNLVDIYDSSKKAKELVYKITKLSRKSSKLEMSVISPETIIDNVIRIVKSTLSPNVTIEKIYDCDASILADESQIDYMLINLVKNADQAMELTGGVIKIICTNDDEFVYISVDDEGPGIKEELLETIFEPFFTTKEVGKGTGLGLSICQQTANDHGGKLTVKNKMSGGAIFTFSIHLFKQ